MPAGTASTPKDLEASLLTWFPATVPGTAASALRSAGEPGWAERDYDQEDWWFRATFSADETDAPHVLELDGIATLADVWVNGVHHWHGENMFTADRVVVGHMAPHNELAICCAALAPRLAQRRERARWRSSLVREQGLRFVRTTLLGRMPGWAGTLAPVGPWRSIKLRATPEAQARVIERNLVTRVDGDVGEVEVTVTFSRPLVAGSAVLRVGTVASVLDVQLDAQGMGMASGAVQVPGVERWWPHTHGEQPLYPVHLDVGDETFALGTVGFRTITVDRSDDGFQVLVNDVPVFCRGALWTPPDVVSLAPGKAQVRDAVVAARRAHMNMLRIPGTMVYGDDAFFDACDELGVMVWQDCMLANFDFPGDAAFETSLVGELDQLLSTLQGRPCLAVMSGGSEIEQQAAMAGVDRAHWACDVLDRVIPTVVHRRLPGAAYVTSSPTGGVLPFSTDAGVAHYFGVGAYLRPLDDVRRSGVRFAAECLAFSVPPSPETVDQNFGGPALAGHHPDWKAAVPRDAGSSWDFEDVRDHYVAELFGLDVARLRTQDPERYLEFGRAAVAECMSVTFSEWRRAGSRCGGGLVLSLRDLRPGAGWGVIDSLGRPKAPWFVLRRLFSPIALLLTEEGLNGLAVHVVNDPAARWRGTLRATLLADGETAVEQVESQIEVPGHQAVRFDLAAMFPGFRDLTYAYRFGPPGYDVIHVELCGEDRGEWGDGVIADAVHLPLGSARPEEHDLGLSAIARPVTADEWVLDCSTRRFAQWVSVEVPGFAPTDSWFHLVPGSTRPVGLRPTADRDRPRGEIRALNARVAGRIVLGGDR